MTITAKIIKDSISAYTGTRITTFELEYPRFIHCFDEETEVLSQMESETPLFRKFKVTNELGFKVAQYNPDTEEIEFVQPSGYVENYGVHKMVNFKGNSKKFSMLTTDKHRVFTLKRTTNNEYIKDTILAEELLGGKWGSRRIPQAGYHKSKQILTDDEIQLIAWFVADGHKPKEGNQSSFHFRKERKVISVCDLLDKCGIEYKVSTYETDTVIRFDSPPWVQQCYTKDGEKCYPSLATNISQGTYTLWKKALFESDGNLDNQDYNTYSEIVAEQIQAVASIHGDAVNLTKYGSCFKLKFQKTNYISLRYDKDSFEEEELTGSVYCVSVPTSYLLVRREGKPYISGNCELMTHRTFSRNAASSRAIPISKMMKMVEEDPAMPIEWGVNQAGMQAKELHKIPSTCEWAWRQAAKQAVESAISLQGLGLHKQIVNRVLEPFQTMKTIVTATSFDNFFWLRNHKDAQPEIKVLAEKMLEQYDNSKPFKLYEKEYHLPYIQTERDSVGTVNYFLEYKGERRYLTLSEAIKLSVSCCAQVSYRLLDYSFDKAERIYNQLVTMVPVHASPFENVATPVPDYNYDTMEYWLTEGALEGFDGVTHIDHYNFYSGNFRNWIQYRQLIPKHTVNDYKTEVKIANS